MNTFDDLLDKIKEDADSLKPIDYIYEKYGGQLNGEYRQFLKVLERDLRSVEETLCGKRPFEYDVDRKIKELTKLLKEIELQLNTTPQVVYVTVPIAQKLISLGELKAEYEKIFIRETDNTSTNQKINNNKDQLEKLEEQYAVIKEKRELIIETLPREEQPEEFEKYPMNDLEKDYKAIISSAAFRRLQDKTQVFPLDKSDFVRTRLTHSLEVSTIARQLGIMITQNKSTKKLCSLIPDNLKADYESARTDDENYNLYLRFLMVTDFISGMTDSYAKNLYQELNAY